LILRAANTLETLLHCLKAGDFVNRTARQARPADAFLRDAVTSRAVGPPAMIDAKHDAQQPEIGDGVRIAVLNPTFYNYAVPLYEELHRYFGDRFVVIALDSSDVGSRDVNSAGRDRKAWEAANMGSFPRRFVKGVVIKNGKRTDSGQKTPIGLTIAPGLVGALRDFRPDIVVSVNLGLWTLTSILLGYPTIIFWEGTRHTERTVGTARLWSRRWLTRRSVAFVVNGAQSREYVANVLGMRGDLIFEGGLGPDLPPPEAVQSAQIHENNDRSRFLFVGRLIPRKGVSHLLRATRILLDRGYSTSAFDVTIVGDGPERADLENLSSQLALDAVVRFAGDVGTQEVWKYHAASDVFVLPTLQDNWPLVVPEAMSLGKAILLSTCAGSSPDLVDVNENGFTFDPSDHGELARLMAFYIDHPDVAMDHGAHSREIALKYSPEQRMKPYISAVRTYLERGQRKPIPTSE
jgi:glycosyltransferase involved in cell wall biosynthesis